MQKLTRRLMIGASLATIASAQAAVIFSGQNSGVTPSGPTGINTSSSSILLSSLASGTFLATATMVGGTLPMSSGTPPTLTGPDAGKLQIANINNATGKFDIQVKSGATASPATNWQFGMTVTDNNGLTFASATTAYSIVVPAAPVVNVPVGNVNDNDPAGTPATSISVTSPIAITNLTDTTANSNFNVSPNFGSSSSVNVSNTGPGGIGTQAVNIQATDALGFTGASGSVNINILDHTASNLLATFDAVNTSLVATAVNSNTIMYGHPFKKGQLPGGGVIIGSISGTTLTKTSNRKGALAVGQTLYGPNIAPGTKILSGSGSTWTVNISQTVASTKITMVGQFPLFKQISTVCKFSMGQPAIFSDGSLKLAVFILQLPLAIPGSGRNTISILTNGTAPASPARTTSDVIALDAKFTGTILHSVVSGEIGQVWAASANDALTNGKTELYAWGDAGNVYCIDGDFKRSGVAHGQMRGKAFVQVLQNSAGGLYGYRLMYRASMPYYDVNTPVKGMRTFSSLVLSVGATTIRDMARQWDSAGNPFAFSWVSGSIFQIGSGDPIYGTSAGGLACNLTTNGTLPAGLVSGGTAPYFTRGIGGQPLQLHLSSKTPAVVNGGNIVSATNAGSGQHTLTIVPALAHFASLDSADKNAMYDYIQGGGSVASETTVRFEMDTAYWISTKLFLPYDTRQGVTNKANQSVYLPSAAGGKSASSGVGNGPDQSLGTTGDIQDLGPIPLQCMSHLCNQDALSELVIRVNGLTDAAFPMNFRNSNDNCIPGLNNTVYPGMTSQQTNLRWDGADPAGFTPAETNLSMVFSGTAGLALYFDHMPEWSFYPYVFTGEPQYRDTLLLKAAAAILSNASGTATATPYGLIGNGRNITVGSNTYCTVFSDKSASSERVGGWCLRSLAQGAGALADSIGENPYYKDYLTDVMNETINFSNDYIALCATQNSFVNTLGIFSYKGQEGEVTQPQFMMGYRLFAVEIAAGLGECAGAFTLCETLCKYNSYLYNNISLYTSAGSYDHVTRLGRGSPVAITGVTKANPGVISIPGQSNSELDIVEIINVVGMTQLNNQTYQLKNINDIANTAELWHTDGTPVDTTGFSTYVSGGIVGPKFITSLSQWAGQQKTNIGWTNTGSRRFTVASTYVWTGYKPRDGDAFLFPFPAVHAGNQRVPAGFGLHQPIYYAINTSGNSFDLCTTPGDAGTIVLPTDTAAVSNGAMVQIVTPTVPNTINFPDDAGTYWLVSGPAHAGLALGISTVDPAFVAALDVQDSANDNGSRSSPAANCKYRMTAGGYA